MFPRPVLLLVGVVACLALGALVLRPLDMAVVSLTSGHQAKAPSDLVQMRNLCVTALSSVRWADFDESGRVVRAEVIAGARR